MTKLIPVCNKCFIVAKQYYIKNVIEEDSIATLVITEVIGKRFI